MWRLSLVWFLSLASILLGSVPFLAANAGSPHARRVHETAGPSSDAAPSSGSGGNESSFPTLARLIRPPIA
jgi:hypothetical protein